MKKILLFAGIVFAFFGCSKDLERSNPLDPNSNLFPPGQTNNQIIEGKVLDNSTMMTIPNAQVTTDPATKTVMSNDTGNYQITDVTPGNYTLKATAPWFAQYTSNSFNVTSTQKFVMDIVMNTNIVFQETFNAYTPGLIPPNPPWFSYWQGGSIFVEVPPPPEQFTYGCKLYSGNTASDYARITTSFSSGPAFKVVCKMLADIYNSAAGKMRIKLLDINGTPIIEFGFADGGAMLGVGYDTPAISMNKDITLSLLTGTYYFFIIEADNVSNTVNFYVKDKNNTLIREYKNIPIWPSSALDFKSFSAEIGCDVATIYANGYIDDIIITKK
ncbi:MAG: carboxypeptidase-like regulatory domain-containing protein [Candidatus Firestonebacteria bacterium]